MNELALFAGAGGGLLAGRLLGWRTRCAVEIDAYARSILLARQRDGMLDRFPIWDDVRTFDGRPWRGSIDVVSGGFPCQDISSAGRGRGLAGARSGLWFEMLRIIGEVRPRFVFAENSPNLRTRGLGTVIQGLTGLGYDCRWGVLGAGDVGAPHERKRLWLVAHANDAGQRVQSKHAEVACASDDVCDDRSESVRKQSRWIRRQSGESTPEFRITNWDNLPDLARMDDGLAHRMDRVRATGNGQVPAVAALAWRLLSSGWESA